MAGFPAILTDLQYDENHYEEFKKCKVMPLPLMNLNENVVDEMEQIIDLCVILFALIIHCDKEFQFLSTYRIAKAIGLSDDNFPMPNKLLHVGDQLTVQR